MGWNAATWLILVVASGSILGLTGKMYISEFGEYYQNSLERILSVIETLFGGIAPIPFINESESKEYDFIIIGSGSAGSVIANRLTEIGNWNVLLLEAGRVESSLAQYPSLAPTLQFTDYNWNYITEPEEHACLAMENQRAIWPRGKALGGTTVINYMAYTRGNPEDYNRWAALGNPGWIYEDVLPYFLKSEDARLRYADPLYHSVGGYQSVEDSFTSELGEAFLNAGEELGYQLIDNNSPTQIGFTRFQATQRNGRRHSVANSFLKPILHRENLHILTDAKVTKILIDPSTNRAHGVIYNKNHKKMVATATKEVIVSAGVVNSPLLIMLSGIGRRAHLEEFGIETLSDLPVGEILYDHLTVFGLVFNTNLTANSLIDLFDSAPLTNWYTTGTGPLTRGTGGETVGFINTNTSKVGDYPDLEIIFSPESLASDYGVITAKTLGLSDYYYQKMFSDLETIPSFTIVPLLLHPKSKGHLKLKSSDPYDYPLLYGNYLTDPENIDARTLLAGIRFIMKLSESEAFKKYDVRLNPKPFIGCEHLPYNSDEYWYCVIQLMTTTRHHQTSTCKMGPVEDPTAVVNHELKVYGIRNLRVADTSIVPIPLSAHMNAPTIMIGEKLSDLIKHEWGVL